MSVDPRVAAALPGPALNSTFHCLPACGLLVNSTTPSARSRFQNVPAAAGHASADTTATAMIQRASVILVIQRSMASFGERLAARLESWRRGGGLDALPSGI